MGLKVHLLLVNKARKSMGELFSILLPYAIGYQRNIGFTRAVIRSRVSVCSDSRQLYTCFNLFEKLKTLK